MVIEGPFCYLILINLQPFNQIYEKLKRLYSISYLRLVVSITSIPLYQTKKKISVNHKNQWKSATLIATLRSISSTRRVC